MDARAKTRLLNIMKFFLLLQPWGLVALLAVSNLNAAERSAETLTPDQPSSALRGSLLRGLGVNVYDAFTRALEEPNARPVKPLFLSLRTRGIPFVRFSAGGYWPVHWGLYLTNRNEHFRRLDAVFEAADQAGLGLIPSLFWHPPTISDLSRESFKEWGRPESKTRAFMQAYTRDVVSRYRHSPALRAWEFGNEFNLGADLPNAAEHRPPTHPSLGTPAARSQRDELSHATFRSALAHFANEVRTLDPHHLILSGNAFPRPSAWHQLHERSWNADTETQWTSMLEADNPAPFDTVTGRLYSDEDLAQLPWAAAVARRAKRFLFIGEFGVPGRLDEAALRRFQIQLEALERHRVDAAALWVVDFDGQAADWNVTAHNDRVRLLDLIAEWNKRHIKAP